MTDLKCFECGPTIPLILPSVRIVATNMARLVCMQNTVHINVSSRVLAFVHGICFPSVTSFMLRRSCSTASLSLSISKVSKMDR